jgi:signal transduction histidine kinase
MRIRSDGLGAEALNNLDEIDRLLKEASKELRAFTYLLHPPDLQREGLSATLGRYVEGFGARTELKITVKLVRSVDQLSLPLQLALLRIVQEALTNVYRHASATRVSIKFRRVGKRLSLVICDNGQRAESSRGSGHFGHQDGKPLRAGLGIPGMIARVQQFGGNLVFQSGPNGAAVHATVPVG